MRMLMLLLTLIHPAAAAAQSTSAALAGAVEAELGRIPANTAVYLKHLKTGDEVGVRADVPFNSQSVIKIPIMVRAFQMAEQGALNLDERITLGRADLRDGSGVFQFADLGLAPTLRDLILQMVITSDNTATDVMTTKVGGVEALNAWLAKSGYQMRLVNRGWEYRRKLLARLDPRFATITAEETTGLQYAAGDNPLFAHYQSLFTGERARWLDVVRDPANRRRRAEDTERLMVEDRNIWLGDMTARDIGRMLEAIERETIVSAASAATIRTFMRRQLAGSRRLPHFVDCPRGAQDRRCRQHRQRRRHHLLALRTNRDRRDGHRHQGFARRSRGPHRPHRRAGRQPFRQDRRRRPHRLVPRRRRFAPGAPFNRRTTSRRRHRSRRRS